MKEGLYFAKSKDFEWWDWIVEVYGEEPFQRIHGFSRARNQYVSDIYPSDILIGPMIEVPPVPKEMIIKI